MAIEEYPLPQKTYNLPLLNIELRAALPGVSDGYVGRMGEVWAVLIDPTSANRTTALNVANAHDSAAQTTEQKLADASSVTQTQIITYLKTQLTSASPDTPANIKAQVQAYVNTKPELQNAITNAAALFGYNTGTNVGYLQAVFQVLGIFS